MRTSGRGYNVELVRTIGLEPVAQPQEGDLTTRRFPLSGILGTVRT